jgi:antitoxin YefM
LDSDGKRRDPDRSNESGEPTAFIVPIELWREIASERETAHLLRSSAMTERLLQAMQRMTAISIEAAVELGESSSRDRS